MKKPCSIYDFVVKDNHNNDFRFWELKDKVILIVNIAGKCGFTPQLEGLETLYKKFKDRGLIVIGFPCNQFGNQEPGTDSEIESFCKLNYGVTFPIMKKIKVNGSHADPIFKFLKKKARGFLWTKRIKWNFTKFLISADGTKIKRFHSAALPKNMQNDIKKMLKKIGN